jgi:adenylate cyclase
MQPHLILHSDRGDRTVYLTNTSVWTVGRSEDSSIVLDSTLASRNHAVLQIVELKFCVIDLGSRNGTFVNGRRAITPVTLSSGDEITFGETNSKIFFEPVSTPIIDKDNNVGTQKTTVMLNRRRLTTVLVVDIRDFTILTRKLKEKVLSEVIGTWFGKATEIINNHSSWVDKYIGDAVMAVWVHKEISEDGKIDPSEIYQVFQSLYALHKMSDELNNQFSLPFRLRVGAGINTGFATVGQIGAGNRAEYTAIGDTVNQAFRLESITKEIGLDIALGDSTYFHCANSHLPFNQYQVTLKGYDVSSVAYAGNFDDLKIFLDRTVK